MIQRSLRCVPSFVVEFWIQRSLRCVPSFVVEFCAIDRGISQFIRAVSLIIYIFCEPIVLPMREGIVLKPSSVISSCRFRIITQALVPIKKKKRHIIIIIIIIITIIIIIIITIIRSGPRVPSLPLFRIEVISGARRPPVAIYIYINICHHHSTHHHHHQQNFENEKQKTTTRR